MNQHARTVKIAPQGECELVIERDFNAPRPLVFEALTTPELVKRWLLGPDGWSMPICEIDLRIGGAYRYVWRRDKDGSEMGMGGVFREIVRPERIVCTESFDDPWYPGESVVTFLLNETSGVTTFTQICRYESREARDGVLKSNMEKGVAASYRRLDELLAASVRA